MLAKSISKLILGNQILPINGVIVNIEPLIEHSSIRLPHNVFYTNSKYHFLFVPLTFKDKIAWQIKYLDMYSDKEATCIKDQNVDSQGYREHEIQR